MIELQGVSAALVRTTTPLLLAAVLVTIPLAARAHHSWGAVYNGGNPVKVTAVIAGDVYRNPHHTVDVNIVNERGEAEEWKIEWRGERGRGRDSSVQFGLSPGDEVVIDGRTARDSNRKSIQMQTLTRVADGMTIQAREGRGGGGRRDRQR